MESNDKNRNYEFGKFAEEIATQYYVAKGYAILERNWHHGKSEIDIIAQINNIIVFIEVKARSGKDLDAVGAVTFDKMRRMARAANTYIRNKNGDYEYRFDIFALTGNFSDYKTEAIEDAFLAPLT